MTIMYRRLVATLRPGDLHAETDDTIFDDALAWMEQLALLG